MGKGFWSIYHLAEKKVSSLGHPHIPINLQSTKLVAGKTSSHHCLARQSQLFNIQSIWVRRDFIQFLLDTNFMIYRFNSTYDHPSKCLRLIAIGYEYAAERSYFSVPSVPKQTGFLSDSNRQVPWMVPKTDHILQSFNGKFSVMR